MRSKLNIIGYRLQKGKWFINWREGKKENMNKSSVGLHMHTQAAHVAFSSIFFGKENETYIFQLLTS